MESTYSDTPPKVTATGNSLNRFLDFYFDNIDATRRINHRQMFCYLNEVEETPGDNGVVVKGHIEGDYSAADSDTAHIRGYLFERFDRKLIIKNLYFGEIVIYGFFSLFT